jgi:hypothetical protein
MKYRRIAERVYEQFLEAREEFFTIHDRDLVEWALMEYELPDFKVSSLLSLYQLLANLTTAGE